MKVYTFLLFHGMNVKRWENIASTQVTGWVKAVVWLYRACGGLKMLSMDIIALHLLNVGFSYIEHQTYADMKHHICFDFRHNISHFEYI